MAGSCLPWSRIEPRSGPPRSEPLREPPPRATAPLPADWIVAGHTQVKFGCGRSRQISSVAWTRNEKPTSVS